MWVGLEGGISRFDPATDAFVNYRPMPDNPASLTNTEWISIRIVRGRCGQGRGAVR